MPARSETPGLVRRQRKNSITLYWRALSVSRKAGEYPDQMIRLPADAGEAEIAELCEQYTARLDQWLNGAQRRAFFYDGTIASLCDCFERHPDSPMREVKWNTADSYGDSLKVIRATIGARAIRAVVPVDAKRWYANWRRPAAPGGPERIKRAHGAVSVLRMILRFGMALGYRECGDLADGLAAMRFERSARRDSEMTFDHARAFIAAALASGKVEDIELAAGVACQFETLVRQKDVIGEYPPGQPWRGAFTWEAIPGGIWRLRTSKTGAPAQFHLPDYELLWPLLQAIPQSRRSGAIVKNGDGTPIREGAYRKRFRKLAAAAGIPKGVWNMDARAGGITEGLEAGADMPTASRAATHANPSITEKIYARRNRLAIATMADIRKKGRAGTV